ncbi:PspA/IM30 family protein [Reyranella sp. CPCC 100927]|uniref:PspA/IM30 family protein n=1 Tax=Reyranella sp. CPCC 100927 TaxID=2599616 RepID=UPI0011B6E810|nr:PspA/IM30 family protein [Reyranella sp. CPCC 100927]TWT06059.1 PspA/IM30 family protein [Reyranella sp. CPCC 100927]
MVRRRKTAPGGFIRLRLEPDAAAIAALGQLVDAYAGLAQWLDVTIPADHSADHVVLHRNFYERARQQSGLPAQLTTLALRDWAARRRGLAVEGVPLDERLYSVRGIATVSIATLDGRVGVPFAVAGYGPVWPGGAPARLVRQPSGWELRIESDRDIARLGQEERTMATETVVTRIGRVIAGMTHAAISAAEDVNPEAVMEQAIREIDGAADEVRGEMGKAMAEKARLDLRRKELERERGELDENVKLAVGKGRDDLAEAGIDRQLDIEAQLGVLARLAVDADEKIGQLNQTLDAVRASRREAETRLADLKRTRQTSVSGAGAPEGETRVSKATGKVERAQAAIERLTGVPSGTPAGDQKSLDDLNELARKHAVAERLARLKAGQG